jgi:hypothetical protein
LIGPDGRGAVFRVAAVALFGGISGDAGATCLETPDTACALQTSASEPPRVEVFILRAVAVNFE